MTRPISALPLIGSGPARLFGRRPFPLSAERSTLWHNARAAIWHAIKVLDLKPGARVLMPAYCCGSELDVVIQAGLEPVFYAVDAHLMADLDGIESECRRSVAAIYVIHFFGFAQPMDDILSIADRHGVPVLEDCAPALYSSDAQGRPLGSRGAVAVFSFAKSLPVPDGGALIVNRSDGLGAPGGSTLPGLRPVLGRFRFLLRQRLGGGRPPAPPAAGAPTEVALPPSSQEFPAYAKLNLGRRDWRISVLARALLALTDHDAVCSRRQRNFSALSSALRPREEVEPVVATLPPGCCPWFLPIRVERRLDLKRFLVAQGIGTREIWDYRHPAVPVADFAFEMKLKDSILALPVHQDLGAPEMARIAEVVNAWRPGAR